MYKQSKTLMYTINSLGLELTGQSVKERKMVSLFFLSLLKIKKKKLIKIFFQDPQHACEAWEEHLQEPNKVNLLIHGVLAYFSD